MCNELTLKSSLKIAITVSEFNQVISASTIMWFSLVNIIVLLLPHMMLFDSYQTVSVHTLYFPKIDILQIACLHAVQY